MDSDDRTKRLKQEPMLEKPMKIICHGDSLTEGSDIENAYTWTSLLEYNLRVPVLIMVLAEIPQQVC